MSSRLSDRPVLVGNSGAWGASGCSPSQALRTAVTVDMSGVRRSFRPLSMVWTWAPTPRVTSWRVSPYALKSKFTRVIAFGPFDDRIKNDTLRTVSANAKGQREVG
jgi:hypothetical protein